MSNPMFNTEKQYLDATGLKALIVKIGEFYTEYSATVGDLTTVIERLDAIYDNSTDPATGMLKDAQDAIVAINDLLAGIRAELGTAPDTEDENFKTIYERLEKLEEEAADYEARISALENTVVTGIEKFEYNATAKTIELGLTTANADKTNYQASIDVTDFIVDGMIEDVKLVTAIPTKGLVVENHVAGTEEVLNLDSYQSWSPAFADLTEYNSWLAAHEGHKFLLMVFNRTEKAPAEPKSYKAVLVETTALFNDYDFEAKNNDNAYVTLAVTETAGTANDVNKVEYTVDVTDKAKEDFSLVEGTKPVDPNNVSAGTYKGIVGLNEAVNDINDHLGDSDEEIAKLRSELGPEVDTTDANFKTVYDRVADIEGWVKNGFEDAGGDVPGLLTRVTEIENFIDNNAISASDINDAFDILAFGKEEGITLPSWAN